MRKINRRAVSLLLLALAGPVGLAAAETLVIDPALRCLPMNSQRLHALIMGIDSQAVRTRNFWQFRVKKTPLLVVTDVKANRFRAMAQVIAVDELAPDQMVRLMQANFDSALDARYAVQGGKVWSTFVHPLDSLTDPLFRFGIDQVVNLVETFGDTYSSGGIMFRGGDSPAIELDRERRGEAERLL